MDAALSEAQQLSDTSRWDGHVSPNELAEVLSLLLPLLPLDNRARAACVCFAWRGATGHPALWEELNFERCAVRITEATLGALCARAGAALRTLCLESDVCKRITGAGVLTALRDGGCTGLRRLCTPYSAAFSATSAEQVAFACPTLQHAACTVRSSLADAIAALTALPGPLTLSCSGHRGAEDVTHFAEYLRVNTTLTVLDLCGNNIGDAGATQLADCLRVNRTLTSLSLYVNRIGDVGAMRLVECLRVNTTLRSFDVGRNNISAEGMRALREASPPLCMLRVA